MSDDAPGYNLESTIPSYLTSRPSRDLIIAGHQQITRDWWERRRGDFQISISQFVLGEARAGDTRAARERLQLLQHLPLLDITSEVVALTPVFWELARFPRRAATDAAHIAVAAVHGMDFLITCNCFDIANAVIVRTLASICREHGCESPGYLQARGILERVVMQMDPIVEEVPRVLRDRSCQHGFDIRAILAAAKNRQQRSRHKVVTFVKKKQKLSA